MDVIVKKGSIFGKRQIILAVLVLALSAAVYLNWQFASADGSALTGDSASSKYMGDAAYVNNPNTQSAAEEDPYFKQARADRESAREEALADLKEIADDVKTDEQAKRAAGEQAAQIAKNRETESSIETLLKAKGFSECIAVLGLEEISVVVKADPLLESQTVQINDVVLSQTGLPLEKITIVSVK